MEECDNLYRLYLDTLENDLNHLEKIKYMKYEAERRKLNANIIGKFNEDYINTIDIHDDRKL